MCGKFLGLESGKGACFGYQLKRCIGVCMGKESPEMHYLRVKQALVGLRLKRWPYAGKIGIREQAHGGRLGKFTCLTNGVTWGLLRMRYS